MTTKERMARKLRTRREDRVYARRKTMVEPVFGQTKHIRGLMQFLLGGFETLASNG